MLCSNRANSAYMSSYLPPVGIQYTGSRPHMVTSQEWMVSSLETPEIGTLSNCVVSTGFCAGAGNGNQGAYSGGAGRCVSRFGGYNFLNSGLVGACGNLNSFAEVSDEVSNGTALSGILYRFYGTPDVQQLTGVVQTSTAGGFLGYGPLAWNYAIGLVSSVSSSIGTAGGRAMNSGSSAAGPFILQKGVIGRFSGWWSIANSLMSPTQTGIYARCAQAAP